MTKRYSILRKKLQELESKLCHYVYAFSLPVDDDRNNIPTYGQNLSDDIEQNLVFISNLLSAEIASQTTRPHHLHHMVDKLENIQTTFRQFRDSKNDVLGHRADLALPDHQDDLTSTCSCTESCINDDGEALNDEVGSFVSEEPELFLECLGEEKAVVEFSSMPRVHEFYDCFAEEIKDLKETLMKEDKVIRVRNNNGVGNLWGAMTSGVMIGMGLMGVVFVRFSGCFDKFVDNGTLIVAPT